jgi:hypothetical protein
MLDMKKSVYILGMFFLMLFATSCLDKAGTTSTLISDEAKITRFYLYSDSIEDIDEYVFTIDNDSMLIYNYDSIDYGTRIDSLSFVINPKFSSVYINDTLDYYNLTEVYLNFTNGVKFTVVASDKKTSADYYVKVNVHQVDPDTFIWKGVKSEVFAGDALSAKAVYFGEKLVYMAVVDNRLLAYESETGSDWAVIVPAGIDADLMKLDLNYLVATDEYMFVYGDGKLYRSADAGVWTEVATSGAEVENLLFAMENKVYAVAENGHMVRFDGVEWVDLGELPSKFPVEGGAVLVAAAPSGKERVFVVGGIDAEGNYLSSVWSSENGEYWSDMTGGKEQFTPRAYAAVAQYGDGLMLFGGHGKPEGSVTDVKVVDDAQIFSKDFGLTWSEPKDKSTIGDLYVPRYEHSAVVTPVGYIYLIGGRTSAEGTINDVWMGVNYASLPGFRR